MNNVLQEDLKKLASTFIFKEELKNKTVLITGATGLIGSTTIYFLELLNKKYDLNINIIGIARNKEKVESYKYSKSIFILYQDIETPIALDCSVDYIIHTACPTQSAYFTDHPVEVIKTSVNGSINIFELAKKKKSSVIFLSSIEVYGQILDSKPLIENEYGNIDFLKTRSSYPESKRIVECLAFSYVNEYGVDIKIARLTQTIGPSISVTDNRVFAQFAKAIIFSNDIVLFTEGTSAKSYIYTIDALNAFFYMLFRGEKGEAYNIANEKTYISIKNLAIFLIENFNPNIHVDIQKKELGYYPPESKINLDTTKLKSLGWLPLYNLKEMFQRLIKSLSE